MNVKTLDNLFEYLCNTHLDIVQDWLIYETAPIDIKDAFRNACEKGYMATALYLYQKYGEGIITIPVIRDNFLSACSTGHIYIADWLFSKLSPIMSENWLTDTLYDAFAVTCENGHLFAAQWIWEKSPINYNLESMFRDACGNGHLQVAKWLLEVQPTLDVAKSGAFEVAANNGQLDVMTWLVSEKNVSDEYDFQLACKNGHLYVVQLIFPQTMTMPFEVHVSLVIYLSHNGYCK